MNRRPLVRMLLASAATAAVIALCGCDTDSVLTKSALRSKAPLSPQMIAELHKKHMEKGSPILVRIFKEEAQLEVWKKDDTGRFALLKTYPICRWSGELGPKIKEGDRQAPEGFYTITPGQMNPNSNYYLAFNTGYPNAYDRAWGHTGSELMVHGDCSSRGCYAMTDEQIGEIYALAREAFFGGQKSFQLEAFPFRMTPVNMARHRTNPNMPFWKMLKVGYDHFEVTHLEPKVNVCERHYVFDAQSPAGSATPISFNPSGKCPTYEVPADIVAAVTEKEQRDAVRTAELIRSGTPVAPIKTGTDGGMNPVFVAALQEREREEGMTVGSDGGAIFASSPAPGTLPAVVINPPHAPNPVYTAAAPAKGTATPVVARAEAKSRPASRGGLFASVGQAIGLSGKAAASKAEAKASPEPRRHSATTAVAASHHTKPKVQVASNPPQSESEAKPAPHESAFRPKTAARHDAEPAPAPAVHTAAKPVERARGRLAARERPPMPMQSLMRPGLPPTATALAAPTGRINGSQPALAAGSFESRWSALR